LLFLSLVSPENPRGWGQRQKESKAETEVKRRSCTAGTGVTAYRFLITAPRIIPQELFFRARRGAQTGEPFGPIDGPIGEAFLQVAQHLVPGLVELEVRLVPLAAVAPAGVGEADAGLVFAGGRETHDHQGALLAGLR